MRSLILTTLALVSLIAFSVPAKAGYDAWLYTFVQEARSRGIKDDTLRQALNNISPNPRVLELDRKQPEGRLTYAQYKKNVISSQRIQQGRLLLKRHGALLNRISRQYGVAPQYIVALWGMETSYGQNTGGFDIFESLLTLAYDGRRSDFFRGELLNALEILQDGPIRREDFKGSWAGAMGQSQFMPSSYKKFAVDGEGDGIVDIWNSQADVFASAANYLKEHGWEPDMKWGRAVRLPSGFDRELITLDLQKSIEDWRALGVKTVSGTDLPLASEVMASVVQPDGEGTDAFLVYNNFRTIMKWNKSTYFALSVGILADQLL